MRAFFVTMQPSRAGGREAAEGLLNLMRRVASIREICVRVCVEVDMEGENEQSRVSGTQR